MTIVKEENYLAERFVYFVLKGRELSFIENELTLFGSKQMRFKFFNSLINESNYFQNLLKSNNFSDPSLNKQTSHFDLEDDRTGINIKYLFDYSANSRIRDLTKELVIDLQLLMLRFGVIDNKYILNYEQLRNGVFRKIGESVRINAQINLSENEELYIKFCYLICLNLITYSNRDKNIFFIKFHSNGSVHLFHAHSPGKRVDLEYFLSHIKIIFSKNIPKDPHKKTIQFNFVIDNIKYPIGFFEVRSNGRVMLHLRENEGHWYNLQRNLKYEC